MKKLFFEERFLVHCWVFGALALQTAALWACNPAPRTQSSHDSGDRASPVRQGLGSSKDASPEPLSECARTTRELSSYANAVLDGGLAIQVPQDWQGVTGITGPGARLAPSAAIGLTAVRQGEFTFKHREQAYRSWRSTAELSKMIYPTKPATPMNLALDRRLPWSVVVEALAAQPTDEVYLAFPAASRLSSPAPSGERWTSSDVTAFYMLLPDPACRTEPPFDVRSAHVEEQRANVDAVLAAYGSDACNCRPSPKAMREGFWRLYHGKGMATAARRVRLAKAGDTRAVPLSAGAGTRFEVVLPKLLELAREDQPIAVRVDDVAE